MLRYHKFRDENGDEVYHVESEGYEILHNSILNKGSAFPLEERKLFNLDGYLPSAVSTLEMQVARRYEGFTEKTSDLEKYIYVRALQDRNETLFYSLLMTHLEEMVPIVYTPTVGLACQMFSHIFRFTRGIFLSPDNIDRVDEIFQAFPNHDIEMIVATDSEGILGIGDQGIGGMGIPVGKSSLYVAAAGIHPANCLPVTLDVGTNNEDLLKDPLYLGVRRERLRGDEYFEFVDKFVEGVKDKFPNAILQWEDFSKQNAFTLLQKYRSEIPSFNDDIQGTGAVTLAGIIGALQIKGEKLTDQQFAVHGAGAGGIGVARQIRTALIGEGLSEAEAGARIYVLDSMGVIFDGRDRVDEYKREFSRHDDFAREWSLEKPGKVSLLDVAENAGISVLAGFSGVAGSFSEEIVRAMAGKVDRPVIFPLSNPTDKTEAAPEDIYRWTDGKAIVSAGSPFPDVQYKGKNFVIGQGNNVYVFPGVGLGAILVGAKIITDEMFTAAGVKLAGLVSQDRFDSNCVYPPISDLRTLCRGIAVEVAKKAIEQGVAGKDVSPDALDELVDSRMWIPQYARLTRGPV
ncbi:MAG TPA: NAD-dependent malic enzyme [Proteobacteria bacterium]|nr:putative NAD-dependent malic enzyme 2 [bacterium BMS3Abin14]HDL53638.1 NAD-dependent malic enzyme [Pseudomonadota bacterium]